MSRIPEEKPIRSLDELLDAVREARRLGDGSHQGVSRFLKISRAILEAMTPIERRFPLLLDRDRRSEVARLAKLDLQSVDDFLREWRRGVSRLGWIECEVPPPGLHD